MSKDQETPRYFWMHQELTKDQARAVRMIVPNDVFVETETHRRTDEEIRESLCI
jgi:hypothetical protein